MPRIDSFALLTDAELVAAIRGGSEAHFGALYARYFPRVFAFTASRIRNRADAEEVVQEVFMAAFRSLPSFRGDSALLTWIFGIARNTINSHLRRLRNEDDRLAEVDHAAMHPAPSIGVCSPHEQLELRRYLGAIEDQLRLVSPWQLDVYRLRNEENLPIREIARRTERTADAVRSSLYRVKKLMTDAVDAQRAGRSEGRRPGWSAA